MKPIIQVFTFSLLAAAALQAAAEDEVKVVKGQISDYYIPVVKEHLIRGTVSDAASMTAPTTSTTSTASTLQTMAVTGNLS